MLIISKSITSHSRLQQLHHFFTNYNKTWSGKLWQVAPRGLHWWYFTTNNWQSIVASRTHPLTCFIKSLSVFQHHLLLVYSLPWLGWVSTSSFHRQEIRWHFGTFQICIWKFDDTIHQWHQRAKDEWALFLNSCESQESKLKNLFSFEKRTQHISQLLKL